MKTSFKLLLVVVLVMGGLSLSQYTFNEVNPWIGIVVFGLVAIFIIQLILKLFKNKNKI